MLATIKNVWLRRTLTLIAIPPVSIIFFLAVCIDACANDADGLLAAIRGAWDGE